MHFGKRHLTPVVWKLSAKEEDLKKKSYAVHESPVVGEEKLVNVLWRIKKSSRFVQSN